MDKGCHVARFCIFKQQKEINGENTGNIGSAY